MYLRFLLRKFIRRKVILQQNCDIEIMTPNVIILGDRS